MKTTLDLPDDLVRALKLRAVQDQRKLKDIVAEALRAGLKSHATERASAVKVQNDRRTGLPVIQCRTPARKRNELTPERVAAILADQEAVWAHDSG